MGILNPKPRFGLETNTGRIYDYIDQKEVDVSPAYWGADGHWNLVKVRDLISTGQTVESARIDSLVRPKVALAVKSAPRSPVPAPQAIAPQSAPAVAHHPATAPAEAEEGKASPLSGPGADPIALTSSDLHKLGLTTLQMAALGLTLDELNVRGITAKRKAQLGITPARAKVLSLTEAQLKALS